VPDHCSCGAELPPDARFCHKCGKPQRADDVPEERPVVAAAAPPQPAIGFHNSLAVRIGLMTALVASVFNVVLFIGCPLWLVSAGFLGAYLYQRRSGAALTVGGGARIGWISGVFSYLIFAVLATIAMVSEISSGRFFERLKDMPFFGDSVDQMIELFRNPVYLAINLLVSLLLMFVLFAVFSVTGGALGAKMLSRTSNSSAAGTS
jgi:hypothetical protein